MHAPTRTPRGPAADLPPCPPPSALVGRRVRITDATAHFRSLSGLPVGVVTQVLDLGYVTLLRVRGEGSDLVGDFSPDELDWVE